MVCLIQIVVTEFAFFSPLQRTEWMTCDCRVRQAAQHSSVIATKLHRLRPGSEPCQPARGRVRSRTHHHQRRDLPRTAARRPALAATCLEQPPVMVKGFREPVRSCEVPWKPSGATPVEAGEGATVIFRKEPKA